MCIRNGSSVSHLWGARLAQATPDVIDLERPVNVYHDFAQFAYTFARLIVIYGVFSKIDCCPGNALFVVDFTKNFAKCTLKESRTLPL